MRVNTESETFDLFQRWKDNGTLLRVSARFDVFSFDLEGTINRVAVPLLGLEIEGRGFLEFRFDGDWGFAFAASDAMRAEFSELIGSSSSARKLYEFGEVIVAVKVTDRSQKVIFNEIVGQVD